MLNNRHSSKKTFAINCSVIHIVNTFTYFLLFFIDGYLYVHVLSDISKYSDWILLSLLSDMLTHSLLTAIVWGWWAFLISWPAFVFAVVCSHWTVSIERHRLIQSQAHSFFGMRILAPFMSTAAILVNWAQLRAGQSFKCWRSPVQSLCVIIRHNLLFALAAFLFLTKTYCMQLCADAVHGSESCKASYCLFFWIRLLFVLLSETTQTQTGPHANRHTQRHLPRHPVKTLFTGTSGLFFI